MSKQRGVEANPPVSEENADYVRRYLQRKFGANVWAASISSADPDELNVLINIRLSRDEISRLRAAWRKHAQYLRDSARKHPPVSARLSGEAHQVLFRLLNSAERATTISDVIVEYLSPIADLPSTDRDTLVQQLQQRSQW